jgi:hypothetical protein
MKQFIRRTFCLYLAIQVLFASTGFAMYEHWCLMKGTKTISFIHQEKCQKISHKVSNSRSACENSIKRSKCCSDKISYYKVQTPSADSGSVHFISQHFDLNYIFTPTYLFSSAWINQVVSFRLPHYYSAAPPLYGRSMLVFIQSFLI